MKEIDLLIEKSEELLIEAIEIALKEVERLARKELHQNKKLRKFTMTMGTYFFSDSHGVVDEYKCDELDSFIFKYYDLHLTGSSMTFTKDGEVITNW